MVGALPSTGNISFRLMLSPNDGSRIVLLPEDKQLIELAGWTETEYREFVRFCRGKSRIHQTGRRLLLRWSRTSSCCRLALPYCCRRSAQLTTASYLSPKAKTQSRGRTEIRSQTVDGQNIVDGNRYAPKAGFDSLQNVVELGSVVPLVYAKRETVGSNHYGGVRVNTNMLWSQVLSLGGDQLLRGLIWWARVTIARQHGDRPSAVRLRQQPAGQLRPGNATNAEPGQHLLRATTAAA